MPAVSEPSLPHTWRPLGVRLAFCFFGGLLVVVCVAGVVRGRPRGPGAGLDLPAGHRGPDRRSRRGRRVGADALPGHRHRGRGSRSSTATAATPTTGPRCSPSTCRRARRSRPSTSPTAPAARPWRSSRPTATAPGSRCGSCGCCWSAPPRSHSSVRIPQETDDLVAGLPGRRQGDQVAAAAERVGRGGHRLHGERLPRRVPPVVGAEHHQPRVVPVDPERGAHDRWRGRAPGPSRRRPRPARGRRRRRRAGGRAAAGPPGSRTACPSTSSSPTGSCRSSASSRVDAGRVSSQPSTGAGPARQVGVGPRGVRRRPVAEVGRGLGHGEPVGRQVVEHVQVEASTGSRSAPSAGSSATPRSRRAPPASTRPTGPGRGWRCPGSARSGRAGGHGRRRCRRRRGSRLGHGISSCPRPADDISSSPKPCTSGRPRTPAPGASPRTP